MSEQECLLSAILAAPDDDLPRLIYADWLEENGDPDRAEFIRVQCRLAGLRGDAEFWGRDPETPTDTDDIFRLEARSADLLVAHRDRWLGGAERPPYRVNFRRGFPEIMTAYWHTDVGQFANALARAGSVNCLVVGFQYIDQALRRGLLRTPGLAGVRHLRLANCAIGLAEADALSGVTALTNLTHLDLGFNRLGHDGVRALLEAEFLEGLTHLDLAVNGLGDAASVLLAGSPRLAGLKHLGLRQNRIGCGGARALAASPHLAGVPHIDLRGNRVGLPTPAETPPARRRIAPIAAAGRGRRPCRSRPPYMAHGRVRG